jgi:hypothetical protein
MSMQGGPRLLRAAGLLCCLTIGCAPALIDIRDCRACGAAERFLNETRRPFSASGEARLCVDGEHLRCRMDVRWLSDSSFSCTFYDPFSQPAAILSADSSGVWLDAAGGRTPLAGRTGNLQVPGYFSDFPLTFGDFIRILSGRLPAGAAEKAWPDSCKKAGPHRILIWKSGSSSTSITEHARNIDVAACRCAGATPWEVHYDRFTGSQPRRMKIAVSDGNYCIFMFDTIRMIGAGASAKDTNIR